MKGATITLEVKELLENLGMLVKAEGENKWTLEVPVQEWDIKAIVKLQMIEVYYAVGEKKYTMVFVDMFPEEIWGAVIRTLASAAQVIDRSKLKSQPQLSVITS